MKKSAVNKKRSAQNEDFATILKFIRGVRNLQLGSHPIRAEAIAAEDALNRALGEQINEVYETKTWKK